MSDSCGTHINLLHITAQDAPVGPGKQILRQSVHLSAYGVRPTIVGFSIRGSGVELLRTARALGLDTECIKSTSGWDVKQIRRLIGIARRRAADVLVTHGHKADLVGLAAARLTGIPIVAYARGWTGEDRRVRFYEGLDRTALRFMDRVVAVSGAKREELLSLGLCPAQVVTVANAVDVPERAPSRLDARLRLLQSFALPAQARLVAIAGRLSPEKAQSDFLRACSRLASVYPQTHALVFGDGPERGRLETWCRDLGIGPRVTFCGHRSDFVELLPGLDLLVLSSLTEGLPNVVLEAFAMGVPVVATAVGGVPEIAQDGVTALLAPPAQPDKLASAMIEALSDKAASARRAKAARALVQEHYGFAENARQFAKLIHQVAKRDRAWYGERAQ